MSIGKLSKKIREIREENNKVITVDLGVIDMKLEGLKLPFKIKPFNEVLKIKASVKLSDIDIANSLKTIPFKKLSPNLQQVYRIERPDLAYDSAFVTVIDHEKNNLKLEKRKLENKILDCIIHIDFDSFCEDEEGNEITLWEDLGVMRGDYTALLPIFFEVLNQESLIDCFEKLIEYLKNRIEDEKEIQQAIVSYRFYTELNKLEPNEREKVLNEIQKNKDKILEELNALEKQVKEQIEINEGEEKLKELNQSSNEKTTQDEEKENKPKRKKKSSIAKE